MHSGWGTEKSEKKEIKAYKTLLTVIVSSYGWDYSYIALVGERCTIITTIKLPIFFAISLQCRSVDFISSGQEYQGTRRSIWH